MMASSVKQWHRDSDGGTLRSNHAHTRFLDVQLRCSAASMRCGFHTAECPYMGLESRRVCAQQRQALTGSAPPSCLPCSAESALQIHPSAVETVQVEHAAAAYLLPHEGCKTLPQGLREQTPACCLTICALPIFLSGSGA